MTDWTRWIGRLGLVMLAAGAVQAAPVGAVAEIDRSVARVGEVVIWDSQLRVRTQPGADRAAVLDELIDEALVLAEARRGGITVDRSEVLAALDEIKRQNGLDDAALDAVLKEQGFTRARYLVDVERQLMLLRARMMFVTVHVTITDRQVEEEAQRRKLPSPLSDDVKATILAELRTRESETRAVSWIAGLRKRAWIERRP